MLKYTNYDVVFQEIPDETTLAINISNCPRRCKGCHSAELRGDIGTELTRDELWRILDEQKGITCVAFMGGESDIEYLFDLMLLVHLRSDVPYKVAWYTGMDTEEALKVVFDHIYDTGYDKYSSINYLKTGEYVEELGPLSSKTTNQHLYKVEETGELEDITYKFWKD